MSSQNFEKQLLINPSGFPDMPPKYAIALRWMLDVIRKNYELSGFSPIETPLVERVEVLTAKAGAEIKTQIYGLRLMNPGEGADDSKDVGLRFDQTVPLARFVAANQQNLLFPFRRYVIGPVFRGETPKNGRYRQFIQADIDAIGDGSLHILHDAEIVGVIARVFNELNIGSFTIRIGHRKVLQGLLRSVGVNDDVIKAASNSIDKLEKIGRVRVIELLAKLGITEDNSEKLLTILTDTRSVDEVLASLRSFSFNEEYCEGIQELEQVIAGVRALGVSEDSFKVDISIARGLDYYTGTVYETRFNKYPDLGSIASGGRYENLASTYTDKNYPGVGISIGVTRLLLRLIEAGLVNADKSTVAPVIVMTSAGLEKSANNCNQFAKVLRDAGIGTEVYLADRNLGKQMNFANKRGFSVAVIVREDNLTSNTVAVRNLGTGEQVDVPVNDMLKEVQKFLS